MAKGQRIQELEMRVIDTEVERDAFAEMAGDYFVGLLTAVDLLQKQRAMLDFDNFLIGMANAVIESKDEEIDRLERAERRRERAEADKQRDADHLKGLHDRPAMANWALVNTKAMVDGMLMTAEPNRYGRKRTVEVEIDPNGQDAKTTATTTGAATVSFDMPVFGRQSARATIEHVETSDTPTSKDVMVRNTITFTFRIGDANRTIKIVSGGKIQRGCGWYVGEEYTKVLVGSDVYYSSYYEEYRGSDAKDAAIETAPMTERRSGGCGGW